MSLIAAAAALAFAQVPECEWAAPRGLKPLMVPLDQVVQNYKEIPADVRNRLAADIRAGRWVDQITIKRAGIKSDSGAEYADLRGMHFADGRICQRVTMRTWKESDSERALIYRATGSDGVTYSIARPEVCRNISLVTMTSPPPPKRTIPPAPEPVVTIPPVVSPPPMDALPPLSFARLSSPDPVPTPEPSAEPEPERLRVDQPMYEPWSRPIFWDEAFALASRRLPVVPALVPPPALPFDPVPGIVPPSVVVAEAKPVIGETIVIPSPSIPPVVVPGTPDKLPALPDGVDHVAPVPEPGTWLLMAIGLGWVVWQRRKA